MKATAILPAVCLLVAALGANPRAGENRPAQVRYSLSRDGNVSLAIYDGEGRQVRTLLNAEPQTKGAHTAAWDGLDYGGKPAAKGEYTWRLLETQGLQAEFLLFLGTNVGIEHWPCQHGGPKAVAVDGDSFLMGGTSEGSPTISKATFEGKVVWHRSGFPAPEGLVDLAADGERLYALMSSAALERLDPKTGATVRRPDGKGGYRFKLWLPVRSLGQIEPTSDPNKGGKPARELVFDVPNGSYLVRFKARMAPECAAGVLHCNVNDKWFSFMDHGLRPGRTVEVLAPLAYGNHEPVHVRNGKLTLRFNYEKGSPEGQWAVEEIELMAPAERVDARDGAVAVLFSGAETVAWVDPETGALTAKASVPGARDVALVGKDELFCAAGDKILRVRRETLKPEAVVDGLTAAERLSFDPARKQLFVWCGGARQQVLVFGADLKPLAELGRAGGRKTGLYQAGDFLAVSDLAADGRGGFVVTEADSAPRRTAWFDGRGKLLGEWYGGQQFYTFAVPDPEDPGLVWMDSQWGWLMQVSVDYAKRTWKPRACYRWAERLDALMFHTGKMTVRFFPFHADLATDGQKHEYLWFQGSGMVLRVDEAAGLLQPVAYLGRMFPNQFWNWHEVPPEKFPPVYNEALAAQKADPKKRDDVKGLLAFGWADANDDGRVQAGEMRLLPASVHKNGHGFHGHGSVVWLDTAGMNQIVHTETSKAAYHIRPPIGRTPQGYPIWDWRSDFDGKLQGGGTAPYPFTDTRGGRLDAAGNLYLLMAGGGDGYAAGLDSFHSHGAGWPGTLVSRANVAKFSADGKLLWAVGNKAARADAPRGQVHHPVHVAGFVKGIVGVCDYFMAPCHFWTEDGLFAGDLLDGRVQDGLPARMYSWWRADKSKGDEYGNLASFQYDMLVGGSLAELPNGDVVFLGAGWNNVPVYRVHGLDRLERQNGTLTLAAPAPAALENGTGLLAEYFELPERKVLPSKSIDPLENAQLEPAAVPARPGPALKQTDAQLWFGGGDKHKWPGHDVTKRPFDACWTGLLEPRFTEPYTFSIYAVGRARLYVGGRLVLDSGRMNGDDRTQQNAAANRQWKEFSKPVRLEAGRKIPIRAEWEGLAGNGELHVNWESMSQQIEHLPAVCLYPELPVGAPVVSLKAAAAKAVRPGTGAGKAAEFVLTRTGRTDQPLTLALEWRGTAKAGTDYQALPIEVTIPAGKPEARLSVTVMPAQGVAKTCAIVGIVQPSLDYLLDGTTGEAALTVSDGRAQRLEVADVQVKYERATDWAKSEPRTKELRKMIDGSGLDRSVDPPTHGNRPQDQWWGDWLDPDKTELIFDLGAVCEIADLRVWNANFCTAHGKGPGEGDTVRHWSKTLRVFSAAAPDGPWTEAGEFTLHRPSGKAPEPPDVLPLGVKARCVKVRFHRHTAMEVPMPGLSEVEFLGVKAQ